MLIPYISNGPLISWMLPGIRRPGSRAAVPGPIGVVVRPALVPGILAQATGIPRALGSCAAFLGTITIIPFMPDGWCGVCRGFPGHGR